MKRILIICMVIMAAIIFVANILSLREKLLERRIKQLNREIYTQNNELQRLKAEWNYLNNKDYLKMLISKYFPELKSPNLKTDVNINNIKKLPQKGS